jgi:hypothetical protein
MNVWSVVILVSWALLYVVLLDTRRQMNEISEQVSMLQRDFISEIAAQYGGLDEKK